ncbi:Adaptin N terminal region family protein [Tritrichomonas foetus]|uniref:Adaptin N terminal region family protein n=1 Tax=Tritrichomonas foetus TaxID=1144522 RepID=A0A1J4L231_9EUKA|nr:Adaptin N terminal region family protein [Tritrichomonas foetus]|eukprot:OHT17575.1 Adaptin N terminal region family protein [Tritrichomonas foetus]
MSASQVAVQQGELQELSNRLQTATGDRVQYLGRVVALDAQGVDCTQIFPICLHAPDYQHSSYIKGRRFVGILDENYLEKNQNVQQQVIQSVLNDFEKSDPLLKGIAVRHAGKLSNDSNVDKFVPVILRGASSDDPYVRKASALAILNLHHTKPSFVDRFKLGPILKNLVEDSNPNVAANAVAALTEINAQRSEPLFTPNSNTVNNLLAAIDQATEWSQTEILDFVSTYKPKDAADARGIIARVTSRLSHANAAVVLSAIRCCLQMNMFIDDQAKVRDTLHKVVLPLVTLLNNSAPIQYIAVKSILVLLQNYKRMLSSEVSIFFCKYDDPLYMKLAKLDVILTLTNTQHVGRVLDELYEYAQQTDIEFVRKSIRAIGRIAVQFESAAAACVDKIVSLIDMKVHFVVQECIVVAVDIFRRYPGKYEGIISNINAALSGTLDDHRAKAAMVWILGEYAAQIGNAGTPLALFLDDFCEETADVQLSIITAVVKYYLICEETSDGDDMLRRVINMATNQVDNPDVRDRAFMYLALVSECPDAALDIIFPDQGNIPKLHVDLCTINPNLVSKLVPQIGTLAVLYNKEPHEFVVGSRYISMDTILDKGDAEMTEGMRAGESSIDKMKLPVLLEAGKAYGVEIRGTLLRIGDQNSFVIRFTNFSEIPLEMQQIAFNKNIFGFAPGEFQLPPSVNPQKTLTVQIPVVFSEQHLEGATPSSQIQIAVLVNRENPIFFEAPARLDLILVPADQGGKMTRDQFKTTWQGIDDDNEISMAVNGARIDSVDVAKHKMNEHRLFFLAKKGQCAYFSGKTIQGEVLIVYIIFEDGGRCQIGVKMWNRQVSQVILELVKQAIQ